MDLPGFFSGTEAQQPLPMFNPRKAGQSGTVRDTRKEAPRHDGPMSTTTTGRKKAAATSKGHPSPRPVPAAPQRAKKPTRPTSLKKANPTATPAQVKLVDRATKATEKAYQVVGDAAQLRAHLAAIKAHLAAALALKGHKEGEAYHRNWAKTHGAEMARLMKQAPRLNPSDAAGLAKVWKAWTGTDPGQSLQLQVEEPHRYGLPLHVVLLGRVTWLATKDGKETRFGVAGPYMVTDAAARKIWLVSHKAHHFDLEPALIGYTARKPKFGDRATVEYVHAFEGRTHAVMAGQVGALTGSFRITPAGLEG